ncbi:hypothetical protein HMPREF9567_00843 [Cutibacterium acnes HL013PA1]|nr:hypothetical protein HMPREF9567_00843 [Cutibacterium acnes HL013PA1]
MEMMRYGLSAGGRDANSWTGKLSGLRLEHKTTCHGPAMTGRCGF